MVQNDGRDRDGRAATDAPAKGSKWIWILGAVFLGIIVLLLIRGFVYAGTDTNYENTSKGAITDVERDMSTTDTEAVNTSNSQ
jgi:cytoskeletal protein RodZ